MTLARAADSYFRQKAGVKMISAVKTSIRPRNIESVQIQVWKSDSEA